MADPARLTGTFGGTLETLRDAIANSAYFQTWTGTANPTAALGRIYQNLVMEADATRPYCVVGFGENAGLPRMAAGPAYHLHINGTITARFVADLDTDNYGSDPQGALLKFQNDIIGTTDADVTDSYDGVMTQVIANLETGNYLTCVQTVRPGELEWFSTKTKGVAVDFFEWEWHFELFAG